MTSAPNPLEAAHHLRTLPGRTYGPHDAVLRITPPPLTGAGVGGRPAVAAAARRLATGGAGSNSPPSPRPDH
ncbi:hypothetical protein [Streptomyces narbonensis]|uniref:hypothetical protein n=1 Tax=Streptomyces narbonensis TaxID=67333 RepID=UPI0016736E30|nr:hypothetical protein [Streptomyces narbonensis]